MIGYLARRTLEALDGPTFHPADGLLTPVPRSFSIVPDWSNSLPPLDRSINYTQQHKRFRISVLKGPHNVASRQAGARRRVLPWPQL